MPWVRDVHSNGEKIPPSEYENIRKQVKAYAAKKSWKSSYELQLRFKSQFCYVDALEKDGTVSPLGRLRYLDKNKWSVAFFTYSNDRYEPCALANGNLEGTLKECLKVCETYLV